LNGQFKLVISGFDAGSINQPEVLPAMAGFGCNSVAGSTRLGRHNSFSATDQDIE